MPKNNFYGYAAFSTFFRTSKPRRRAFAPALTSRIRATNALLAVQSIFCAKMNIREIYCDKKYYKLTLCEKPHKIYIIFRPLKER